MRRLLPTIVLTLLCLALGAPANAHRAAPEDYLKGKIIISDRALPMHYDSVSSYVRRLRALNKGTLWYDKKSGKVTVNYAAFFAQPVDDVQVNLVIYDITGGATEEKTSTENFMERGQRALFNSVVFDKEDLAANRKYLMVIESRHRRIATGTVIVRAQGPHYSGKVTFSDDETK